MMERLWRKCTNLLKFGQTCESAPSAKGRWGEEQAARHLTREKKMRILARNWRNPVNRREEIDLVAMDGLVLVFVEVKTRRPEAWVRGIDAVNRRKRAALRRACRGYLKTLQECPLTYRLDVVEVVTGGRLSPVIRHYENVTLFS